MKLLGLLFISLTAQGALAFCDVRLAKSPADCSFQERTQTLREEFSKLGVDPGRIAGHRALRFIGRRSWNKHLAKGIAKPWEVYEPAPKTWIMWDKAAHVSADLLPLVEKDGFEVKTIQLIHSSAMDKELFTRTSFYLKGARKGKIRSSLFQRPPEFWIKCEDGEGIATANLLKDYDLKDFGGKSLVTGKAELCPDKKSYSAHVMYMQSTRVKKELKRLVESINQWFKDYESDREGTLSPLEAAADFQRWFVSIHPFGDGNGRTSRFLQDMILGHAGLMPPASGDLSNDLLTPKLNYREDFKKAMESSLSHLEGCLLQHQEKNISPDCAELPLDVELFLLKGV